MSKGPDLRSNVVTTDREYDSIDLDEYVDGKIVAVSRIRKTSAKPEMGDQIGLGLRSVYNDVLSQPVPDRFFDLLRQLETASGAQFKKDAS